MERRESHRVRISGNETQKLRILNHNGHAGQGGERREYIIYTIGILYGITVDNDNKLSLGRCGDKV